MAAAAETQETTSVKRVPMTDEELARTLRPIYYGEDGSGGFQGAKALHAKLPKGAASLERVRKWIHSTEVGAYTQLKAPKPVYHKFIETVPMRILMADLCYLPHDTVDGVTYRYALTVIDTASRWKAARPVSSRRAEETAAAFQDIMTNDAYMKWPELLITDSGGEFKGATKALMTENGVRQRWTETGHHRSQCMVEAFNRDLAARLFRGQYKMELESGESNSEWVARLQPVVTDMNNTVTDEIRMKPADAVKLVQVPIVKLPRRDEAAAQESLDPPPLRVGDLVYYSINWESEDGDPRKRRYTDPRWNPRPVRIQSIVRAPPEVGRGREVSLYYLEPQGDEKTDDLLKHGFTRSQIRPARQ